MAGIDQRIASLVEGITPSFQAYLNMGNGLPAIRGVLYFTMVSFFVGQWSATFDFSTYEELGSVACTEEDYKYRTADGTCNNKALPKMGAAGMRFGRNVRSSHETETPPEDFLWEPRPERVASAFLTSYNGKREEIPGLNLFFSAWIQFQTHDWFAHSKDDTLEAYQLKTRRGKSFPLKPTKRDEDGYMRSTVTHWWDQSQIYGSDLETQHKLRSFSDGKMTMNAGFLPKSNATGQMDTGFTENLWSGLEIMHTLYVKEHNYICDQLKERNPGFGDEELFQTARLINNLQNSIIHTDEWTTLLIQNAVSARAFGMAQVQHADLLRLTNEYLATLPQPEPSEDPAVAGPRFSHTEDFVAVYRMHALLPDDITVGNETQPLQKHSFASGRTLVEKHGMERMIGAFAKNPTCKLTTNNYPKTLSMLDLGNGDDLDMGAIDIFRDRERGMPKFNEFRMGLGLPAFTRFEDITSDAAVVRRLKKIYKHVDDIDMLVGQMAEEERTDGMAMSETTFRLFLFQTPRRTAADRFLTTDRNAATYTEWGLNYALTARFKRLFTNNYPSIVDEFPTGAFPFEGSAFLKKPE